MAGPRPRPARPPSGRGPDRGDSVDDGYAPRDFADERLEFAIEAGLAALRRLVEGYGYEITGLDVWAAYANTVKAADKAGRAEEVRARIRTLVASETYGDRFVTRILGRDLGL